MYLHVTANDCNLDHDPENDAWYLRVLLVADLRKMHTWKKCPWTWVILKETQEQKFDSGKAKLHNDDIKLHVVA